MSLERHIIEKAFPFYFVLNGHGCFDQVGPGLQKLIRKVFPQFKQNQSSISANIEMLQVFSVSPDIPPLPSLPHNPVSLPNVFVLELVKNEEMKFRGQFFYVEAGWMFIGTPWASDFKILKSVGLGIADFPPYDPTVDLMMMIRAQNITIAENRELSERLQSFNEALEVQVKDLQSLNNSLEKSQRQARSLASNLEYQARHDPLTGLLNRFAFESKAAESLSQLSKGVCSTLCFLDLDHFKAVNDACGHLAGDELLKQVSIILQQVISHSGFLARSGGDEFLLYINPGVQDVSEVLLDKIIKTISGYRFSYEGMHFSLGVSIGAVLTDDAQASLSDLMKKADTACYRAKDAGRNGYCFYTQKNDEYDTLSTDIFKKQDIEACIHRGDILLYGQPIYPLKGDNVEFIEVLTRLPSQENGVMMPGRFIPLIERFKLSSVFDRSVIEQTFEYLHHLLSLSSSTIPTFFINLSGYSICDPLFQQFLTHHLKRNRLVNMYICFEITETSAVRNMSAAIAFILHIQSFGCRFALDDFGSGFASFGYLQNLPVDFLKIDGSFVKDVDKNPSDKAIVRAIHEIAHSLNKKTIAEHIESSEALDLLTAMGVDYGQGFFWAKPQPLESLDLHVNARRVAAPHSANTLSPQSASPSSENLYNDRF